MRSDPRKFNAGRDPVAKLIVYEDNELLVLCKPPGMITSSGPHDARETLWGLVQARALYLQKRRQPMGLIHRLDRDACGLLVFSKNDDVYKSLKTQFFRHTVNRVYMAIVRGKPLQDKGIIDSWLVEWKDGTVHSTKHPNKGERAISHYELCSVHGKYALIRVTLETGRKHQIRVHLSDLKCPIVGDDLYNATPPTEKFLMLVAIRLCFDHPRTGKRMEFELEMPEHMRAFMRDLRDGKVPADKPAPVMPRPKMPNAPKLPNVTKMTKKTNVSKKTPRRH